MGFTIQEGRWIRFRKNDNVRMMATCKVKGCPWVAYASKDHEDTCWQLKTFVNDHTCPREDKNRAVNRNWVANKLVKKVRKYPNFRHCDAATYFKSRFDLSLNKNSISRALFDARNVVFGDENEQYKIFCGRKGHTKRGCKEKKLADAAAAVVEAEVVAMKIGGTESNVVEDAPNIAEPDLNADPNLNAADDTNVVEDAPIDYTNTNVQPVEVELSQPIYFELEESQQAAEVCTITKSKPDKLPPK
ncbi:hypothetical protein Ahy_A04g019208 [Arachis hypogaea]|uniref:Transposase MuDR plant domain-containing protein n=1 Tax=Arachis hypogaea TaxID=3818 RepID=A0A445DFJ8_ARAHY|nr:hypothetical protein Ahy_A04g019208 [Arachis hypogaea]